MSETNNPLPEETRPRDRQELYDRIRRTSREQFILEDMMRLGFWPKNENAPTVPEQIIKRETELGQEIRAILSEQRRVENPEKLLKEMRKQRMAESRKKREENKQRRELERKERAERWRQRKEKEVLYLGQGVSGGLNHATADEAKLAAAKLPVFADATALATAIGITVGELRFLSFSRDVSKTSHYRRFHIAKKTGGQRLISAPMPRLKKAQHWILDNILAHTKTHPAAHGFLENRSIVSNAQPHVGAAVVINLDLKDFFPTVTYPRVKGMFQKIGYSEAVATPLALLCTEPSIDEVQLDGETWYVASGDRFLPQGAPTSPAITNLLCHRLDCRLQGLAAKLGFNYTRYADDLTFSASGPGIKQTNKLRTLVHKIVEDEGFRVHPDKEKVMRPGSRKEVTGIVVNEKPAVDRETLRKFRALLHQAETQGIAGKKWGTGTDLLGSMEGFVNYVFMVDPAKGKPLKDRVKNLQIKLNYAKPARKTYTPGKYSTPKTTQTPSPAEKPQNDGLKSLLGKFWKK